MWEVGAESDRSPGSTLSGHKVHYLEQMRSAIEDTVASFWNELDGAL